MVCIESYIEGQIVGEAEGCEKVVKTMAGLQILKFTKGGVHGLQLFRRFTECSMAAIPFHEPFQLSIAVSNRHRGWQYYPTQSNSNTKLYSLKTNINEFCGELIWSPVTIMNPSLQTPVRLFAIITLSNSLIRHHGSLLTGYHYHKDKDRFPTFVLSPVEF